MEDEEITNKKDDGGAIDNEAVTLQKNLENEIHDNVSDLYQLIYQLHCNKIHETMK